jgi:glycolate oxidase FAD binding subunit
LTASGEPVPPALAQASPQVRAAGPDDAVAGVTPRFVACPANVTEAARVMRAAAAEGLATVPRGAGTRLAWGRPPERCDLVIDTRRMNQVLEHAAGDLVVRVQAGVGLGHLAAVLAEADQRLALDPPPPNGAGQGGGGAGAGGAEAGTVGGMLATGAAGPLRLRYGTPRDLTIGITVVRADGTVAVSGGKVVKNVAGYDLGKLFAGSYGTLGLIVEAVFRLHPRPAATSYVTLEAADAGAACAAVAAAADSPLAPSAIEIDRPARQAPLRVGVLLEGDTGGVAERSERLTGLLAGSRDTVATSVAPQPPAWWGRGAAAGPGTVVRITFWAAALAEVLAAIDTAAGAAGLDPAVSGSAAAGVLYAALDADAAPEAAGRFLAALRAAVGTGQNGFSPDSASPDSASPDGGRGAGPAARGTAVVLHAPAPVRDVVDLWGPVPALRLMRAVKDQFDPEHRMAPGRFVGGI